MTTRRRLVVLFVILLAMAVRSVSAQDSLDARVKVAREILKEVPFIDGHNDAPWEIRERFGNRMSEFDFSATDGLEPPMQTDIRRLRVGGVGGVFWSVWVPPELSGPEAVTAVIEQIDLVHRLSARYPDDLAVALTADDVRRIHASGRVASLIGAEGGHCIGDSLAVLRQLHALGVRYLTLTHWSNTSWADAATDAPEHSGLTDFGRAVVREMNRLGMMVDLSHASEETMRDALDVTRAPVMFSHSNARSLDRHPRNVPEAVLRRVADNGGVVMVNVVPVFLSDSFLMWRAAEKAEKTRLETYLPGDPTAVDEAMDAWRSANPQPVVDVAEVADHIDEIRRLAGIDHVGIGSDFDGTTRRPVGLDDVSRFPNLLAELLRRGYSRDDVAKVAGLNVLRVMSEVERVAAELQRTEVPTDAHLEDLDGSLAGETSGG